VALRYDDEERAIQPRRLCGFRSDGYDRVLGLLVFCGRQCKKRMALRHALAAILAMMATGGAVH
jgi:hypothetical protein